jgi:ClpP class serine protease
MCASAAYWVCCGATRFYVGPTADIGSIGVYQVWYDTSGANARYGFRPVVIRSGAHKGMGIDGITDEQIAAEQENVDAIAELFKGAVADGRGLGSEQLEALATGQTWVGARAVTVGLADRVLGTYTVGQVVTDEEETNMPEKQTTAVPTAPPAVDHAAEMAEAVRVAVEAERDRCAALVTAFASRDLAFCSEQIAAGADAVTSKAAWFDREAAKPAAPAVPAPTPAAATPAPVAVAAHDGAEPVASAEPKPGLTFAERVAALRQEKPELSHEQACARLAEQDPNYWAALMRGEVR